jgi:hypothetical protein
VVIYHWCILYVDLLVLMDFSRYFAKRFRKKTKLNLAITVFKASPTSVSSLPFIINIVRDQP